MLDGLGTHEHILDTTKSFPVHGSATVRTSQRISAIVRSLMWVKQGCPLGPYAIWTAYDGLKFKETSAYYAWH